MWFDIFQVLQQCLLCKSWGNHQNRDEFSWVGFPVWFGFPFKCNPRHLPSLLCQSPKRNVVDPTTSKFCRFHPKFRKITKGPLVLQWGWIFSSKATTASGLIPCIFSMHVVWLTSCKCSDSITDWPVNYFSLCNPLPPFLF